MQFIQDLSPLQALKSRFFPNMLLWVKRDDLLHPDVSGNKFRKLKYPLLALQNFSPSLVTMGGVWSNHLHAIAHAAKLAGYPVTALVRGHDDVSTPTSDTLSDCMRLGMQIRFVSRTDYRELRNDPNAWRRHIENVSASHVWLPEGGSTPAALHGVAELVDELFDISFDDKAFTPDTLVVACGTGATLAGLLAGLQGRGRVLGIAVIKNAEYLHGEIAHLLQQAGYPAYQNYELLTEFHHGGYAKVPSKFGQFCDDFSVETGIPIEPVYTGKMFYALQKLMQEGRFDPTERIVAIHTGGLQGRRSFL
jgi:1-aminocyclopropane-1-carboxylate deaminase